MTMSCSKVPLCNCEVRPSWESQGDLNQMEQVLGSRRWVPYWRWITGAYGPVGK